MGGVFQTVNRVLPEFRCLFRFRLHIQEHTAVSEDKAKQVLYQRNDRKPLLFVSVALLQDATDLIPPEKFLDFGRKTLFIFNINAILFIVQTSCMCLVFCSDYIIPYIGSVLLFYFAFSIKQFGFLGVRSLRYYLKTGNTL